MKYNKNELSFFEDPIFGDLFQPIMKSSSTMMRTDIIENEDSYEFKVDLPGVNKENITLNLEDGYLTISYKEEKTVEDTSKYLRKERYFGSQERSFYVGDIDLDRIEAKFENGILEVILPKEKEEKTVKSIEIK